MVCARSKFNLNPTMKATPTNGFNYFLEQFADIKIMAFQVPGFEELSLKQKKLVYFLSQAALCGRDIIFDQNYKHNLRIRKTLEEILQHYSGDRKVQEFDDFVVYLKRVWFSNGIHHHYSTDKFIPGFKSAYLEVLVKGSPNADFPLLEGQSMESFLEEMKQIIFDQHIDAKRISLDSSQDLLMNSACNYYEGVSQLEAEDYYKNLKDPNDQSPVSHGLNSRLIKVEGSVKEEVYGLYGRYGKAISQIVKWLEKAKMVAETDGQNAVIGKLIEFYQTGNLASFDDYNVLWVNELDAQVDFVNGFIEVYGDPLGMKASWESVVNFKDIEATRRAEVISGHAQWFEDHSPVDTRFKKKKVMGVSAKVITVAQLGGDCYPSTPIGINLPNADWIRKEHGSKSVTMENITYAYDKASQGSGFLEEFCYSTEEVELAKTYGTFAGNLHTDLHECLGHGSGQLLPGTDPEAIKNYSSALEEARADLFALYYIMDGKMVELGILPTLDVAKTEYNAYIRNGLMTQLTRVDEGKSIEQAHMRNRQLVARWCYEKGRKDQVIEKIKRDKKIFYKINDYSKLRTLFGVLLSEVQRIKSEGDYEAARALVETYGVKVDPVLHKEVKQRFEKLNIAPYGGFINPVLKPKLREEEIVEIEIDHSEGYSDQMLRYSREFSFLDY